MTLSQLLDIEDALDCQTKMTREQFLGCIKPEPSIIKRNSDAWDDALAMTARLGSRMRAWNEIQRRINSYRLMDQRG